MGRLKSVASHTILCGALLLAAFLAMAWPAAAESEIPPGDANAKLDLLFEQEFEARLRLDPSFAHAIGSEVGRHRLTLDLGDEYRQGLEDHLRSFLASTDRFITRNPSTGAVMPAPGLSQERQVYLAAFRHWLRSNLALLDHPEELLPLLPGFGLASTFAQTAAGENDLRFDSAADFHAFLGRAEDFETWIDQAIQRLREGLDRQITHPRVVVDAAIRELDLQADVAPGEGVFHGLSQRAAGLGALTREERNELVEELRSSAAERLVPAYRRLRDFLVQRYRPSARPSLGMACLPSGKEWYRERARFFTTTELSPDEIFALGEQESKSLRGQMRRLQKQLRGRDLHRWETRQSVILERFRKLDRQLRRRLPKLFHQLPTAGLEIRPVEASRAAATAGAFYERPAPDGSRPGIFYVNTRRGGFDLATAEVLFLHEGLPGHHLQIALAQERSDLPPFLRFGYFGAYTEGWGLYAESLGEELGLYDDPVARLGALRFALGRAGRLVGDAGLHHRGWSQEVAEAELRRRGLHWAATELTRYATMPGQALGYTVGALEIRRLRKEAELAFGDSFDAADFHAAVLAHGPLPLDVLRQEIRRWISAKSPTQEGKATEAQRGPEGRAGNSRDGDGSRAVPVERHQLSSPFGV